ncbi:CYTH domain-containing protein [Ornithinibacillus scapharcae]|uniref:CYTH domain-containing protein n=1 Tax=Ornithinibacillus scapharcae TaxID=1147159 RepID=UPI000225B29A
MTQEIEIEFKNLLTKQEYDMLLAHLPFPEDGQKQINYYFETPDRKLQNRQSALRIREKNGKYRLTLKEPFGDGLLETHDTLTFEEASLWMKGNPIAKKATTTQLHNLQVPLEELQYYGSLTTIRREYQNNGLIFVLDYSTYHNQEDYELEIEALDKETGLKAFEQTLKQLGIEKRKHLIKLLVSSKV